MALNAFKRAAFIRAAAFEATHRLRVLFGDNSSPAARHAPGVPSDALASAIALVDPTGRLNELEATLAVIAEAEDLRLQ